VLDDISKDYQSVTTHANIKFGRWHASLPNKLRSCDC